MKLLIDQMIDMKIDNLLKKNQLLCEICNYFKLTKKIHRDQTVRRNGTGSVVSVPSLVRNGIKFKIFVARSGRDRTAIYNASFLEVPLSCVYIKFRRGNFEHQFFDVIITYI